MVLTQGIPPAFRNGFYLCIPSNAFGTVPSFSSRQLRTDGVHSRESVSAGPVVFKVVPVTGDAFLGITIGQFLYASLFPHPLLIFCGMCDTDKYRRRCRVFFL